MAIYPLQGAVWSDTVPSQPVKPDRVDSRAYLPHLVAVTPGQKVIHDTGLGGNPGWNQPEMVVRRPPKKIYKSEKAWFAVRCTGHPIS